VKIDFVTTFGIVRDFPSFPEATLARRKRQSIGMSVALNRTFDFLLPKRDAVPEWVLEGSDDVFFAFLAGYIEPRATSALISQRTSPSPWHVSKCGPMTLCFLPSWATCSVNEEFSVHPRGGASGRATPTPKVCGATETSGASASTARIRYAALLPESIHTCVMLADAATC